MHHMGLQSSNIRPVVFSAGDMLETEERRAAAGATRKVLLVVSGRLFRDGLRSLLQASGLTVVGHCDTLEEASPLLNQVDKPDLIMVDTNASAADVHEMRSRLPGSRWILLSDRTGRHDTLTGAGFDWILFQDVSAEILHHVIELMLLGHSLQQRGAATPAAEPVRLRPAEPEPARPEPVRPTAAREPPAPVPLRPTSILPPQDVPRQRTVHLSDRETEILQCLVNGASNKAIARELNIAEATVKVHVKGLLRKMQLQNRTQAAIWAVSNPLSPKLAAAEDVKPAAVPDEG